MTNKTSHCARCEKRTHTVLKDQIAYCTECGSSHIEMAQAGLNTAGPWFYCPFCQERHYYEKNEDILKCEKCHLSIEEAEKRDEQRPSLITYRPNRVTSGSLVEIKYLCGRPLRPTLLSISWLPQHGQTIVRLSPEDERENANLYAVSLEVPYGATTAIIIDITGISHQCVIPIEFISKTVEQSKVPIWKRIFGCTALK